jgi:uncharacterized protein DUF3141
LPPGLYEAVFEEKTSETPSADLVSRNWVMRCESRTLADIRALGGNDAADERRFATAARVSEINLALYRTFLQPFVRAAAAGSNQQLLHKMHPVRLPFEVFGDGNPFSASISSQAERARADRRTVSADNPFLTMEQTASNWITQALDAWRDNRDSAMEQLFLWIYGQPALQAAVGIDPAGTRPLRKAGKSALHRQMLQERIAELRTRVAAGGLQEAAVRALIYAGMPRGGLDERGVAALRKQARLTPQGTARMTLAQFKAMAREQFFILLLEPEKAVEAIPAMLPADEAARQRVFDILHQVLGATGEIEPEVMARINRLADLCGAAGGPPRPANLSVAAKAS